MRRRGSLSVRLRAEVQSSTTFWGSTVPDGDSDLSAYPCEVKPGVFFFKYLQPYESKAGNSNSSRRLRVNLPLTVVAERPNGQEAVLWLETDAFGCVARQEKAPLWRRKLYTDLLEQAAPSTAASRGEIHHAREMVLAVRTTPRWRPKQAGVGASNAANSNSSTNSSGSASEAAGAPATATTASVDRSTVVLTTETFDHIVSVPSELPMSVQRFVRSRGLQASVYRIYWDESEGKSYAVNLLNGLRFADAPVGSSDVLHAPSAPSSSTAPVSIPPAVVLSEQVLGRAAALAEFLCVVMPTDTKTVAKLTKIRGKPVAEPIETAKRIAEHAQLHLPGVRFRAMTLEFLRDMNGTWWFLSVVDFRASLIGLDGVEEDALDVDPVAKASAVHLADLQRTRQLCRPRSVPVLAASVTGNAVGIDGLMTRSCFLCGSLCELSAELKREVLALMKGDPSMSRCSDDTREMLNSIADYRMTLKMALETVYLLRQRGIVLSTWEAALQAVRRSPVQGVVEFAVCLLCYRIFKHQQNLQKISHELHSAFGSLSAVSIPSPSRQDSPMAISNGKNTATVSSGLVAPLVGVGARSNAASSMNTFTAGSLSPDLFEVRPAKPATTGGGATGTSEGASLPMSASKRSLSASSSSTMLDRISSFQREVFPVPLVRHRAHAIDEQHSQYGFAVVDGGAVDPSSTQMRVVFFFHELQDGGPELTPTDFYLEYQLGQCFYRIYLEGSKCHTPNRWQLCEARVHYTLATVEDFTEYCADKKLLIKMKRHASTIDGNGSEPRDDSDDEFFGYAVLSFKPLITAAKWFGNSLLPESRTDYLLELHTTRYGLLTLKLTVGLLVDPVSLRNVRDVVCSRAFLEERAPVGSVYWPPPSLCLCGLAIPRDWIGALMPSEYISVLPMRARTHSNHSNAGVGRRGADISFGSGSKQHQSHPHGWSNSVPTIETPTEGIQQPPLISEDGPGSSADVRSSSMAGRTALSRACMLSKTLVIRIADDASVSAFPTSLLAVILRQTRFQSASEVEQPAKSTDEAFSRGWSEPATFHFTRKLSVDQLVALTRAPLRSTLALLGELLLMLRRNRFIPDTIDVEVLEGLIEPFWLQKGVVSTADSSGSGWQVVPRTSGHLPEHRAMWNRAVRRCDAALMATIALEVQPDAVTPSPSRAKLSSPKNGILAAAFGTSSPVTRRLTHVETLDSAFRYESQTLTLCDLFEEMETLDNGYLDIAELRSLRKIHESTVDDPEAWTGLPHSLELVGTRERLTADEVACIAQQIDEQQRRTAVTTLRSMLESGPMVDALERFDQQGYGNLSFDDFRQLADEALQADRDTFRAFRKEPTMAGFCIRHGVAEVFAVDTICVQCVKQFIVRLPVSETEESVESISTHAPTIDNKTPDVHAADVCGGNGPGSLVIVLPLDGSESPSLIDRESHAESSRPPQREAPLRRRQTITSGPSSDSPERPPALDTELHTTLERLQAAEWHVRHRQESMGKASFRQLIAEHSVQATTRRPSTRTSSVCSNDQGESVAPYCHSSAVSINTSVVVDLPRQRASACLVAAQAEQPIDAGGLESRKKPKTPTAKKKQKGKKTNGRTPSVMKMTAPPLSSLLRMELGTADAVGRSGCSGGTRAKGAALHAARSTDLLIEKVTRTETKRKQLDQLVLAELDEVKQRLARLLHER